MSVGRQRASFKAALHDKDFVVAAELPLTADSTGETLLADARRLDGCVDGFLLTDNQYGQPHMSPCLAAGILINNGFAPIVQLSCRNRNRIALLGELLGARATGIDSLMLIRGNVLHEGYQPRPKAVMDMDVNELIATARLINEDEKLGAADNFLICTSATVHDPGSDWQPEALLAKAAAGAQLIITQVCLDTGVLRRYMESLVSMQLVRRLSVIVTVAAIQSPELAAWLCDNRRGTIVPADFIDRLRQASDPAREALELCAGTIKEIADMPGVSGINFAAVGSLEVIPVLLKMADLVP